MECEKGIIRRRIDKGELEQLGLERQKEVQRRK